MNKQFNLSALDFKFGPDDPHYLAIMRFYQRQMEALYSLPSIPARPAGTASPTYSHALRVAQDVYEFARFSGLSDQMAQNLKMAAELHDIGKLDVDLEILEKPGRLTDDEFAQMKKHTDFGAKRILDSGISHPLIDLARQIALYHHERPDGKGYHGLVDADIPYHIKLVQVCDVYDAVSAERPYRDKATQLTPHQTLRAMADPNGPIYPQVDPEITKKFALLKVNLLDADLSEDKHSELLPFVS